MWLYCESEWPRCYLLWEVPLQFTHTRSVDLRNVMSHSLFGIFYDFLQRKQFCAVWHESHCVCVCVQSPGAAQADQRAVGGQDTDLARRTQRNAQVCVKLSLSHPPLETPWSTEKVFNFWVCVWTYLGIFVLQIFFKSVSRKCTV